MLHKTRGIVLHTIPYSDSTIIAKIYTELFGMRSFMVSGSRRKSSSTKINALQPLTLVEMVIYHKQKKEMSRVKEIKPEHLFSSIPYDISKSSIALFLDEIIYKSVKEEEANAALFEFLHHSIRILDLQTSSVNSFHLIFLVQFSKYLGFYPQGTASASSPYFDLSSGNFTAREPGHAHFLDKAQSQALSELMNSNYGSELNIGNTLRRQLLEKLVVFYELHISTVKDVSSHKILEEVVA